MSEDTELTNNSNELSDTTVSPEAGDPVVAARADVEQTRSNIGETLDAIKEKLDPHTMMDEAKQSVAEVAANTLEKAKETVHNVVSDVATNAREAVTGAVGGVVDGAKDAVGGAVATVKGAGSSVVDVVRRNPMPAALIGIGAVWLYLLHRDQQASLRDGPTRDSNGDFGGEYASAGIDESRGGVVSSVKETISGVSQRVGEMADEARHKAGDLAETVSERAAHAKEWAGEAVHSTVDHTKDFGASLVDIVRKNPIPAALTGVGIAWIAMNQRASTPQRYVEEGSYYDSHGRINSRGPGQADEGGGSIQETAGEWKDRVSEWGSGAWDRTSSMAASTASNVQSSFMRSPLPIGMAVLGIGAAAGLLMPGTQVENRWLGETRDRMVDEGKQRAQDVVSRVQSVAEQTVDTAKETMSEKAREAGLTMDTGPDVEGQGGETPFEDDSEQVQAAA